MAKLRVLSGAEVGEILASHGFVEVRRRGSHVVKNSVVEDSIVPGVRTCLAVGLLSLQLLRCAPERSTDPALRPLTDPGLGWWVSECGDIHPLGVGHDVTAPTLMERFDPEWPSNAPRGMVIIATVLTEEGTVCAARVLRGVAPEIDQIALDAVKRWRFTPALLDGQPRAAHYNLSVSVN